MAAVVALVIALLALAVSFAGAWAVLAWQRDRRRLDELASQLYADSRLEALTLQTLAAMRDAVRGRGPR